MSKTESTRPNGRKAARAAYSGDRARVQLQWPSDLKAAAVAAAAREGVSLSYWVEQLVAAALDDM